MNQKNNSPSVFKSTRRAATGGVLVIGAILALIFLRAGGLGDSDNKTKGTPEATDAGKELLATTTSTNGSTPSSSNADDSGLSADERKALAGDVLTVLIDEYTYRIQISDGDEPIYRESTIERIVALAKQARGDSNGLKVRVQQRENARASAEHTLKNELRHAGISADAVHVVAESVP